MANKSTSLIQRQPVNIRRNREIHDNEHVHDLEHVAEDLPTQGWRSAASTSWTYTARL